MIGRALMIWCMLAAGDADMQARSTSPEQSTQPSSQPATSSLTERLTDIDNRIATITDLRAEFEQQKHTAMLKQPLVSTGSLLVKGDRSRWDTRKPYPSVMAIGDGEIRIYFPESRTQERYAAEGDMRELTGSPLARLKVLRRHFEIAEIDPKTMDARSDGRAIALELTPKDAELREHVSVIRVLINVDVPCVARFLMVDVDGDRTEIEFKKVRINTGVADGDLELHIPDGTRTSGTAGGDR